MKRFIVFIFLCYVSANTDATQRIGTAEVRVQGDAVCFTITQEEFRRGPKKMTYHGYVIEEKNKVLWGYSLKPVPFNDGDCLPYGVLPEGAIIGNDVNGVKLPDIPPLLRLNTLYSVDIFVRTNINNDPTHGYDIQFCLQKQNDSIVVIQGHTSAHSTCDVIEKQSSEEPAKQEHKKATSIEKMREGI